LDNRSIRFKWIVGSNPMDMKHHLLSALRAEFERCEKLLASLGEEEITSPLAPSTWTIKDVIAHLWAWQHRSIARVQPAQIDREPEFPNWPTEFDPDGGDGPDQVNAWIYESHRYEPWSSVHCKWHEGFQQFLEAANAISEEDLLETSYPWMQGYPLYTVLVSSCAHHHVEHFEPLRAWLREHGYTTISG
jgi:hypothetical protein